MKKYPDRFFVGSDEFYQSAWASERRPIARNQILGKFIENLPPEIREKVGCENASRLFRLGENIPAYKKPGPEPNKGNQ
jgi:hypothetical protein